MHAAKVYHYYKRFLKWAIVQIKMVNDVMWCILICTCSWQGKFTRPFYKNEGRKTNFVQGHLNHMHIPLILLYEPVLRFCNDTKNRNCSICLNFYKHHHAHNTTHTTFLKKIQNGILFISSSYEWCIRASKSA